MLVHGPCRAVRFCDVHACVRHREPPIVSFLAEGLPASPGTATPWKRSEVAVRALRPANPRPTPGGAGCHSPSRGLEVPSAMLASLSARACIAPKRHSTFGSQTQQLEDRGSDSSWHRALPLALCRIHSAARGLGSLPGCLRHREAMAGPSLGAGLFFSCRDRPDCPGRAPPWNAGLQADGWRWRAVAGSLRIRSPVPQHATNVSVDERIMNETYHEAKRPAVRWTKGALRNFWWVTHRMPDFDVLRRR